MTNPKPTVTLGPKHTYCSNDKENNKGMFLSFLRKRSTNKTTSQEMDVLPPVVEVTADTFHKIVIDSEKDVLIEFYTKSTRSEISQTYEEVGNHYHMDTGITIAKCNIDQYNIPVEVYHIPTIKLYPAHKKNAPVEYFDKLTDLDQYVVFIKEEGSRRKLQRTNSPSPRGAKNKFLGLGKRK